MVARVPWEHEAVGSNPTAPTIKTFDVKKRNNIQFDKLKKICYNKYVRLRKEIIAMKHKHFKRKFTSFLRGCIGGANEL